MSQFARRFSPQSLSLKHIGPDLLLMLLGLYLSLFMRTGSASLGQHIGSLVSWTLIFLSIRLLCYVSMGVYQCMWRYVSIPDAIRLAEATGLSTLMMISATYINPNFGVLPRSFFFIDGFVCLCALMGIRLLRRQIYEWQDGKTPSTALSKVLIYGAGSTGRMFAQRITTQKSLRVLGYVDDDPEKLDKIIHGLRVLGSGKNLESLLKAIQPTDLIVSMRHPPPELMRNLVLLGRKYNVRPQILGELDATGFQPKSISLYRELELKDLLNRPSAVIDLQSVRALIEGKRVLITGAGGSIGAELSRQVERLNPAKLLLLDHSEFNLYEIDKELRPGSAMERIQPILVDIKDRGLLAKLFEQHKPEVVFHAAAYKHVHLVEANPAPAILNNISGTKNLLDLCLQTGVARFLMISTDKAVNPVGVMGASKRVCELLTSEAGRTSGRPYSSVRFGNVLGSSGSLIPLLRAQIQAGGPVTLTHPDMSRYFMLIPEAVSLVLMSSSLSQPGDISVLRMGDPLRIVDLAKSLMALMGRDELQVPIVFTGVRPGEKMFEELYLTGDELKTRHPDILTVPERGRSLTAPLARQIDSLIALAEVNSEECTKALHAVIAQARGVTQKSLSI